MGIVKFGDIVRDVKNKVDRANNPYEFYVAGDHMDSEDLNIRRRGRFATDDVGPAFIRIFEPGQVLYGSRRTYLKKVAVADFSGICANTTFVLESKDPKVFEQRLLPFLMLSNAFTEWSISKSKGSTNPYVLFSDLAGFKFNLPSIDEQKVLAEKLWAAYEVKQSYLKMIDATDEMLKAQFIEMFGDPVNNTKKISSKKGVELFEFASGKANTKSNLSDEFKYNCYGGNGITGKSDKWLLDFPTLVIGRVGEYCGCVHNTTAYSWITDNAIYIKKFITNDFEKDFLFYLMSFLDFHRLADETGQPKITQSPLLSMDYIIPSKDFQRKYVSIAAQSDKSKAELRKSIDAIDKVIKSLNNENL